MKPALRSKPTVSFLLQQIISFSISAAIVLFPAFLHVGSVQAQTYVVLHQFHGIDGKSPNGVFKDPSGNLCGTTLVGGTFGQGTIFRFNIKTGYGAVLYNFLGGEDGASPTGQLAWDSAGNLYGTTFLGGTYNFGTVYKLDAAGTHTVLYSFSGTNGDGRYPAGGVTLDRQGDVYGGTQEGGSLNLGTIFKVDTNGVVTTFHDFLGPEGANPKSNLLIDPVGNIYGVAPFGGIDNDNEGVIFKIDANGAGTALYSFFGMYQVFGLARDAAGNFFGTTTAQNPNTLYKFDRSGVLTELHFFYPERVGPFVPMIDSAGNIYGAAVEGGANGDGYLYKFDTTGTLTVIYSFPVAGPGAYMVRNANGDIYGTLLGYHKDNGVLFRITP